MFTIMQNAAQKICSGMEAKEADKPGSASFWGIRNAQYTRAGENILQHTFVGPSKLRPGWPVYMALHVSFCFLIPGSDNLLLH